MFKKSFIITGLFLLVSLTSFAQEWAEQAKAELAPGILSTSATSCDGCILRLINEDGDVEYAIEIPENTSTITLPFYLYGEYELQILRGNYCFFGFVEL